MEKLVNKFIDISEGSDYTMGYFNAEDIAEEAKKIAIAYALWKSIQPKIVIKLSDYPDTITADEIYRIELEKEFDKFIEEYYV